MEYPLFSEFDVSAWIPAAVEKPTWQELMCRRLDWNARTKDIRLADWENKLGMKEIWAHRRIPTAEVFYQAGGEIFDPDDLREVCARLLDVKQPFVLKPAHLCGSEAVYLSSDGTLQAAESFSPVGDHCSRGRKGVTLDEAVNEIAKKMLVRCHEREAWALRQSLPGVVVEGYIPFDADLRIMTLWGEIHGAVLGGDCRLWIDADGHLSWEAEAGYGWLRSFWPTIACLSKAVAAGTDMLRVDFFVRRTSDVFVNEMCAFVWPESTTFAPFHEDFVQALLRGYRRRRKVFVERRFGRIHGRN